MVICNDRLRDGRDALTLGFYAFRESRDGVDRLHLRLVVLLPRLYLE